MEHNKNVVFVPYWIPGVLERNNIPLTALLDFSQVSQVLSAQELANVLCFQNINPLEYSVKDDKKLPSFGLNQIDAPPKGITEPFPYSPLSNVWARKLGNSSSANDKALLAKVNHYECIGFTDVTREEICARYNPDNVVGLAHDKPFITYDVDRDTLLVVVYPSFFDVRENSAHTVALCEEVLKVLYVYSTTYAPGCRTPYFRKYLESLA